MRLVMLLNIFYAFIFSILLSSCSTIHNRSKLPSIESFNKPYETVESELTTANSFAFIFKKDHYYFNLAKTYISQGPALYYLGYKNGQLTYAFLANDIEQLKEVFESRDPLYRKTGLILEKIQKINILSTSSQPYEVIPKNSIVTDLTVDTLNFVIYGSIAMVGLPWMIFGSAEYLANQRERRKLDSIRLGMTGQQVKDLVPDLIEQRSIDPYVVEFFSDRRKHGYLNALIIFEDGIVVGILRNFSQYPLKDVFKSL
jgi:hypothetical protein